METTERESGQPKSLENAPAATQGGNLRVRNILAPVDFSEFSELAFRYAASLAYHFGARLYLQHTLEVPVNVAMGNVEPVAVQDAYQAEVQVEDNRLQEMAERVGTEGPDVVRILKEGDPYTDILKTVRDQRIDLLVIGTHGHKGFNRLVHEAACPVLVVSRPRKALVTSQSPEPVPLKTILMPTDFSGSSDRALVYALRWAAEWGGKLILLHAVEEVPREQKGRVDPFPEYNPVFEEKIAQAWDQIRHLVPEGAKKNCEIVYEVRHGKPREEIAHVARE